MFFDAQYFLMKFVFIVMHLQLCFQIGHSMQYAFLDIYIYNILIYYMIYNTWIIKIKDYHILRPHTNDPFKNTNKQ